jgi:hypothetical protein
MIVSSIYGCKQENCNRDTWLLHKETSYGRVATRPGKRGMEKTERKYFIYVIYFEPIYGL